MALDQEGGTTTTGVVDESKMESSPVKAPVDAAGQPEATSTSTSSVSPEKDDKLSKAQNALVQGKRHFLMKDTAHACSALGDACKLLTELYGPIASEHAEAHFFYGRTLLDLARAELSIFEAPANGAEKSEGDDDTEGSEEEEDEDAEKNGDEDEEEGGEEEEESKKVKSEGEEDDAAAKVPAIEEDLNAPSPAPGPSVSFAGVDDEKPSTSAGPKVDGAEPDDLSNLELAWEVLEIAKIGFAKQIEELEAKLKDGNLADRQTVEETLKQTQRRLAETNSVLGEVSTESESYPQAVEDFKTALAMYSELESPDSREIAQVHFHVGVAHGLAKEFQKSIESFNRSVEILRQRMENLKKSLLTTEDPSNKEQLEKEIKELTELLPELEERINDTLEQEKEASKVEAEEKMEEEIIQRNSPVKNPNPPAANDISHLVKKRKKTEEPAATTDTEPPSKKACTNLAFDTAPVNGHSKKEDQQISLRDMSEGQGFRIGKKVPIEGLTENAFYNGGAKYWSVQAATDDGMLGGLGHLSDIELKNSEQLLKAILKLSDAPGTKRALDCGAGIGRITKNFLSRYFEKTDLVDQDPQFIERARENLKDTNVGNFFCSGLQSFVPEKKEYDVVWCQWVLAYLTDDDLVDFLKRCSSALKPNGVIIVKENTTRGTESDVDKEDNSVTRSFNAFMGIFKRADLKVIQYIKQKNFPKDLYPVWAFAMRPNSYES